MWKDVDRAPPAEGENKGGIFCPQRGVWREDDG